MNSPEGHSKPAPAVRPALYRPVGWEWPLPRCLLKPRMYGPDLGLYDYKAFFKGTMSAMSHGHFDFAN